MADLRLGLMAVIENARRRSGPTGVDVRINQVTIRTRTWSGSRVRQGTATDVDLVLPAHYPVRYMTSEDVSSSSGRYLEEDLLVDHITPYNGVSVGYTPIQLKPRPTSDNVEIIYIITGQNAGDYSLEELRTHRPFSYQMVLRRRGTTP